ncbi:hypothetical protein KIH77_08845 [Bifidobacterium sp. 82T24]|uniref:hypothetical protein n=1 Tax=Bifidobacterium pluvialisilvae TaxID=2834436 RepID=UPI001C563D6A|nr:hypothetical protein [Bifidobacterium pluvialisilvae]MBW3088827.1 hypothetical protein [Bifidobacterium pluvialisilvae]
MNYLEARTAVLALLPEMHGWAVYEDGMADGAHPPWIVVSLRQTGRDLNEAVHATLRHAVLDIRVVGVNETSVNIACERLQDALDGAMPEGLSALVPDIDSGTYAAELQQPESSRPYVMRVLTWRTGYPI